MKKSIILYSILILISLGLNAQENKYELYDLYRSDQVSTRSMDDNGKWKEWQSNSSVMLIRDCISDYKIEFNNSGSTVFYYAALLETKESVDSNKDKIVTKIYRGYDDQAIKCMLTVVDYPLLANRNFYLQYSTAEAIYMCRIIAKTDKKE